MKRHSLIATTIAVATATAAAQPADETSIDLQHYRPAPGPATYLGDVRGTEIEPHQAVGFSLFLNYQHKPFVLRQILDGRPTGVEYDAIEYQVGADFLWSLGLFNIVQVGLALPVVLAQDGTGPEPTDPASPGLASTAVRDMRIDLQTRIIGGGPWGTVGSGFGLAGALVLGIPTGDSENFAGDANVVAEPLLIADYDLGFLAAAVNIGARIREESAFLDYAVGHQLVWGLGVTARFLDDRLRAIGEYTGLYGLSGTGAAPQELRLGAGYAFDRNRDITVLLGGGFGFGSGEAPGLPEFRLVAGLVYAPLNRDADGDGVYDRDDECLDGEQAQEDRDGFEDEDGCWDADNDGDGVIDFDDECVDEAEDADGFQDEDGCPEADNDGDGFLDGSDECPLEAEDADGFQDEDGCPEADNDGDGVPDVVDGCPLDAEDLDGFQDGDGCPETDNDGDGIPDTGDSCPDRPETLNGFEDDDGCPDEPPPPPPPEPAPRRRRTVTP